MTLLRRLLFGIATLLLSVTTVQGQDPADGHTIDGGLQHPESVAYDAENDAFYAANIGKKLAPTSKDGDGFISRLAVDGSVDSLRFLPTAGSDVTLHAPKGTVVMNGRLYTADVDRVVGFDLESGTNVAEISLEDEGVSFLNDITIMDDQTLLASATSQGRIYRVDLAEGTATALDLSISGVNGVVYARESEVLYAVNFGGDQGGQLWTVEFGADGSVTDSRSRTVKEGGRFDGIVLRPNDTVLISDWGVESAENTTPALHRVTLGEGGAITTIDLPEWQGPADFTCAETYGCWIPDLPGGTVEIVRPGERTN